MGNSTTKENLNKTYKDTKFLSDQISSQKYLSIKVYLILAKSIFKNVEILHNFNLLSSNLEESIPSHVEDILEQTENSIQIFYRYEQFLNVIDSEDNEFIVLDEKEIKEMFFRPNSNKIVNLIKRNNRIEIELNNSKEIIIMEQKDKGLLKVIGIKKSQEQNTLYLDDNNNSNISNQSNNGNYINNNNNYTNDISNIISLLDCLKNITKLKNYFIDNNNIMYKLYSKFFYDFLLTNNKEYLIKKFISEKNYLKDNIKLIECFIDKMHSELNIKENKIKEKTIYENKHLSEIVNICINDFVNNNKSIISDLFYFEKITVMLCKQCGIKNNKMQFINKLVFDLEEVRKYKAGKYDFFENINIIDCLKYFIAKDLIKKILCKNCNTENLESINKINSPPEILLIVLYYGNNFEYDIDFSIYPILNSDDLNINIDFSLIKWSKNNINENINVKYNLIGFCSYYNNNEGKYCRPFYLNEDNKWILHRPNEIIEVNLKERDKGKPYFLFYQKININ